MAVGLAYESPTGQTLGTVGHPDADANRYTVQSVVANGCVPVAGASPRK